MPHQIAVTIRAPIAQRRADELHKRLEEVGRAGMASAPFRFELLPGVHFARFFVLPEQQELNGAVIPPGFVSTWERWTPRWHVTWPASWTWRAKASTRSSATAPDIRDPDRPYARLRWLREHSMPADAFYVDTVGRGHAQIRAEATLRAAIEEFLDGRRAELSGRTPLEVWREIRAYVNDRRELAWALHPPARPALWWRTKEALHRFGVPLLHPSSWSWSLRHRSGRCCCACTSCATSLRGLGICAVDLLCGEET